MKKNLSNIIKGRFLISDDAFSNWRFIIFLSFLALIMIGSGHTVEKKVHHSAALINKVKELKSERLDLRKQVTQLKMESRITVTMSKKGLAPSVTPPQVITIINKEK